MEDSEKRLPASRYTSNEIEFLKENYHKMSNYEICKVINKKEDSIRNKASLLGLKKDDMTLKRIARERWLNPEYIANAKIYAKKISESKRIKFAPEQIEDMKKMYFNWKTRVEIGKKYGVSHSTINKILTNAGIKLRTQKDYCGIHNPFYGHKLSDEAKLKIVAGNDGKRSTPYSRLRQSQTMKMLNERFGNPMTRPEIREKARQAMIKRNKEHPEMMTNKILKRNFCTTLEKWMMEELNTYGLKKDVDYFYNQYLAVEGGYKYPDFRLERFKLVIEVDGERFHQDIEKERKRDELINKAGYRIEHFTGKEVRGGEFKWRLSNLLKSLGLEKPMISTSPATIIISSPMECSSTTPASPMQP